ncbi:MAG: response regulator [Anaerolineae bacterium]
MILLVDDERGRMASHVMQLEMSGYQVKSIATVDDALAYLEAHGGEIQLLILDIMMASGNSFTRSETMDGLRTGLEFYKRVRQQMPDLPVVVFTNVTHETVVRSLRQEKNCRVLLKPNYLPSEFRDEVRAILSRPSALTTDT